MLCINSEYPPLPPSQPNPFIESKTSFESFSSNSGLVQPHESGAATRRGRSRTASRSTQSTSTGHVTTRVIVILTRGLVQLEGDAGAEVLDKGRGDDGADDESDEDGKHQEVEQREADDATATQLGLLEGVDGWADLPAGTEPEQHNRVEFVDLRDEDRGEHNKEDHVTKQEIHGEEAQFGNLAQVLTSGLRK